MRRSTRLALVVVSIAALILTSVEGCGTAILGCGSAAVATQPRSIGTVSTLLLATPGTVQVSVGPTTSLDIQAPTEVLPRLTSDVDAGTLRLGTESGASVCGPITYRLTVPRLDRIEVDGTGTVTFPDLAANRIQTVINGSGRVTLAGTADQQELHVSGTGGYNADQLATKTATVTIVGSGQASLQIANNLDVTVSGSGIVRYRGNPKLSTNIHGSGKVMPG